MRRLLQCLVLCRVQLSAVVFFADTSMRVWWATRTEHCSSRRLRHDRARYLRRRTGCSLSNRYTHVLLTFCTVGFLEGKRVGSSVVRDFRC